MFNIISMFLYCLSNIPYMPTVNCEPFRTWASSTVKVSIDNFTPTSLKNLQSNNTSLIEHCLLSHNSLDVNIVKKIPCNWVWSGCALSNSLIPITNWEGPWLNHLFTISIAIKIHNLDWASIADKSGNGGNKIGRSCNRSYSGVKGLSHDDTKLMALVKDNGANKWGQIAGELPGKLHTIIDAYTTSFYQSI